jgi:hypothetical protein
MDSSRPTDNGLTPAFSNLKHREITGTNSLDALVDEAGAGAGAGAGAEAGAGAGAGAGA